MESCKFQTLFALQVAGLIEERRKTPLWKEKKRVGNIQNVFLSYVKISFKLLKKSAKNRHFHQYLCWAKQVFIQRRS